MSIIYNGVHSIDFFNLSEEEPLCRNSWEDFHIVPASRPYVALPQYNLMAANVPLTCRRIDLTSSFGKTIASQSGQWEFYIDYNEWEDWASCYRALVNYFHGFKMAVRLKDHEYDRLYVGRFVVQNYAPGGDYSKITIEYYLDPTAETDPLALNLHFQVWWLDWDRRPISYETITWYAHPSSTTSEGTGYTGGKDHDNQKLTPDYPVKISITKLPSKLSYNDGDTINYSGISVTAYNSRGTIWSANSRYLSGLIPYGELSFPISIATISPSAIYSSHIQTLPVLWQRPDDSKILSTYCKITVEEAPLPPAYINITHLPFKLSYNDGDTINYSGISVTAYNSVGSIWSANSRYLSGLIPYSELVFPVSIATVGSATSEAFPVSQFLPVQWYRPDDHKVLSSAFSVAVTKTDSSEGDDSLIMRTYTSYINDEVTYISDYAFYSYSSLRMASFKNVSKIGRYAFGYTSITSLYLLYSGIVSIESTTDLTITTRLHIYVPSSLYNSYKTANVWSNYSTKIYSM